MIAIVPSTTPATTLVCAPLDGMLSKLAGEEVAEVEGEELEVLPVLVGCAVDVEVALAVLLGLLFTGPLALAALALYISKAEGEELIAATMPFWQWSACAQ